MVQNLSLRPHTARLGSVTNVWLGNLAQRRTECFAENNCTKLAACIILARFVKKALRMLGDIPQRYQNSIGTASIDLEKRGG